MRVVDAVKANLRQLLFVFLAFLTMVVVSYVYVSGIVNDQMLNLSEEIMNTTEIVVSSNLHETELTFASTVQTMESMLSNARSNKDILFFLESTNAYFGSEDSPLPSFLKLYAYIRGEFLDGSGWVPPGDYVPQQRPWYIGAEADAGEIYFSEPYQDADTGDTCISFSKVVTDRSGAVLGILAMDLDMSSITNYITNQQVANGGYGILLSETMNIAAHRDKTLIGVNMFDAAGGYPLLARLLENGEPVAALRFTDADGTDSIAFFHTILDGWHIGIITPRSNYYGQVYTLGIVLGVVGFVLMLVLDVILIRVRARQLRADEESKSKTEFLSRMSHEMRTPMNAIIGMTNIARETNNVERKNYALDKVSEASHHLLSIINDVLDISKIEAGKAELFEEDFLITDMLGQVNSLIALKVAEKRMHYTCTMADDVPKAIYADRQRLGQVLANLLGNAVKFTPEKGHVELIIHLLEQHDDQYRLYFEVADDGIGISAEQQRRLFQSFEQADGGTSRKYGGTGLGLAISKKLIDMMGGDVQLVSELGKGARFIFTVTVRGGDAEKARQNNTEQYAPPQKDAGPKEAAAYDVAPLDGKRVLLAEDIVINREILLALLEHTGLVIECAGDGAEAVRMFTEAEGRFDLIFMDVQMPGMDGHEATRRIRALDLPAAKTVPIVAMTANVFKEDVDKSLASGMNDHLGKPLEEDRVMDTLLKYLGNAPGGSDEQA